MVVDGVGCGAVGPQAPSDLSQARDFLDALRQLTATIPRPRLEDCAAADDLIDVLVHVEKAKAWLDDISVRSAGALLIWSEERTARDLDMYGARADERARAMTHARTSMVDEICLATGLGVRDATARAEVGALDRREPERTQTALPALRAGTIGWAACKKLVTDCEALPAEEADEIARAVLVPTRDGTAPSYRLISDRISKQICRRVTARRRRAEALSRRCSDARRYDDGTGALELTGSAERVTAAHDRLSRLARRVRAQGDRRTLAQLCSDIGLDLLLFGHTPALCEPDRQTPHGAPRDAWTDDRVSDDPAARESAKAANPPTAAAPGPDAPPRRQEPTTDGRGDKSEAGRGDSGNGSAFRRRDANTTADNSVTDAALCRAYQGGLPLAHIVVTISAGSLLGLTAEPGELHGWGYLQADAVRDLALQAGSVWSRLVTDPLTGGALELSTPSYRPTAALTRAVIARDHTCRAPGCSRPAERCQLDHGVPWADGGDTSYDNLISAHDRHHGHHTSGHWAVSLSDPDGSGAVHAKWVTQTGRGYVTRPHQYAEPDRAQPDVSAVETSLLGRLIHVDFAATTHGRACRGDPPSPPAESDPSTTAATTLEPTPATSVTGDDAATDPPKSLPATEDHRPGPGATDARRAG